MMMTSGGMLVRISLKDVRPIGRNTQGVRLIRVKSGDKVIGLELVDATDGQEDATDGQEEVNPPSE